MRRSNHWKNRNGELEFFFNAKTDPRKLLSDLLRVHDRKHGFSVHCLDLLQSQRKKDTYLDIRSITKRSVSKESQAKSHLVSILRLKKVDRNSPLLQRPLETPEPTGENPTPSIVIQNALTRSVERNPKKQPTSNLLYSGLPFISNPVRQYNGKRDYYILKRNSTDKTVYPATNKGKVLRSNGSKSVNNFLTHYGSNPKELCINQIAGNKDSEPGKKEASSEGPVIRLPSCGNQVLCLKYKASKSATRPVDQALSTGIIGQKVTEREKKAVNNNGISKNGSHDISHVKLKEMVEDKVGMKFVNEVPEGGDEEETLLEGILADNNDDSGGEEREKVVPDKVDVVVPEIIKNTIPEQNATKAQNWTITPSNLAEQEKLFFESECKVNPVFVYENSRFAQRMLRLFQRPKGNLLPLAVKIIETFLRTHKSETKFLQKHGGELLSLEQTKEIFTKYINDLGLDNHISLKFSYNTVSPTTITHDPSTGRSTVTIGLPIEYRKNQIIDVLNHEIGTHFLRKYNDRFQVWNGARRKFTLKNYIATEEGLASLNQLYEQVSSLIKYITIIDT